MAESISEKAKNIIGTAIVFTLIAAIAWKMNWDGKKYMKKIAGNPSITFGQIIDFGFKSKHGYTITYNFHAHGKDHRDQQSDSKYSDLTNMAGKTFPVIYCATDPEYSYMIVFRSEFRKFGKELPDSLRQYVILD